ncbi:nucleoside monophosphate kinase [Dehalococcoidia bacterium]|nr:nucleoside monophosphate kinase [Dehalococcoidia bacterium]
MDFPIFKTKIKGIERKFDLNNPKERKEYFKMKAAPEIEKIRDYLKQSTFIAYLLGKKNSGKGTYSKMFAEIIGQEKIEHFSIGDMIRGIDKELKNKKKRNELINFLKQNYRGWISNEETIKLLEKRDTETLLPTDLILTLVKREISKRKKKALFIDGFPRDLDQINFSIFFRDLIGYRDDPDIFILIDVPKAVINERIKHRRVCPFCHTSRNFKLLPTSKIEYDPKKKQFYLLCDNPQCVGTRLLPKEGDEKGIAPIKARLKKDEELIAKAFSLHGIPKILLRNSLPAKLANRYVDKYEITPEYIFERDNKTKEIKIKERPWVILDDQGVECVSLLAPPVVVSLIKQFVKVLNL